MPRNTVAIVLAATLALATGASTAAVEDPVDPANLAGDHCHGPDPVSRSHTRYVAAGGALVDLEVVSVCAGGQPAGVTSAGVDAACGSTAHSSLGHRWYWPYPPVVDGRGSGVSTLKVIEDIFGIHFTTWQQEAAWILMLRPSPGEGVGRESGTLDGVNKIDFQPTEGSTLAWSATWSIGGVAIESDLRFGSQRSWSFFGGGGEFDFPTVAAHELGHTFGLGHTSEAPANECLVMYPSVGPGEIKWQLGAGDQIGIRSIYG